MNRGIPFAPISIAAGCDGVGSLEGEDLLVSYKDSEKLVSQDSPPGVWNRILYSNTSNPSTKSCLYFLIDSLEIISYIINGCLNSTFLL